MARKVSGTAGASDPTLPMEGRPARDGAGLPRELVYPWDPSTKQPPRRRPRLGRWLALGVVLLLLAFAVRLLVFVLAISTAPLLSAHFWPFGGPQRANVLVLGYGGQGHDGANLTDSLLLVSSDLPTRRTTQISVPRDLWVQIPPDSGQYAKINSAYSYGLATGSNDPSAGGRLATLKVGQVTGLPVDRWVTIDFQGFRALVDALGGVDVNVERSFTARYPANDNPAIDPNWITVSFQAGWQHMNGETAIRYARARYADTPLEASDFARSQRQQKLVHAMARKLLHPTSWWRVFAVLNALQPAVKTNLSPLDLLTLAFRADLTNGTKIGLDTTNVLQDAVSSDGQDILEPRGGDYGAIARYVQDHLAR